MTLKDLLRKHTFDAIIPELISLDEHIKDNLYAFKEAFDDLRRMTPGDPHGEKIEVATVLDTDDDGNELDRYIHASNCEADPWVCILTILTPILMMLTPSKRAGLSKSSLCLLANRQQRSCKDITFSFS